MKPSSFADNRIRQSPSTRVNSTSGVLPIVERTPALLHITRYSLQKDGCTQDKSVPETSTVAQIAATLACRPISCVRTDAGSDSLIRTLSISAWAVVCSPAFTDLILRT